MIRIPAPAALPVRPLEATGRPTRRVSAGKSRSTTWPCRPQAHFSRRSKRTTTARRTRRRAKSNSLFPSCSSCHRGSSILATIADWRWYHKLTGIARPTAGEKVNRVRRIFPHRTSRSDVPDVHRGDATCSRCDLARDSLCASNLVHSGESSSRSG
jgi:hypothetical protein